MELSKSYRCLSLVGPRQSGKTTLVREIFKDYSYYTFESPDIRAQFEYDPRGFLEGIRHNCIFDEVQRIPTLFSYLQEILDDKEDQRRFILTGSNNLKLSKSISQTLAGRTKILTILPLGFHELPEGIRKIDIDQAMFFGLYPRIFDENLNPTEWLSSYFQTYVEKDIREIINISDMGSFNNFMRVLAGRVGQLINFNSISSEIGVSQPTIKAWFSALETTFICFGLSPHFKNFNKRIIKSPKAYFFDTGLLCYLLRIKTIDQLKVHPLRGQIFENWVICEYIKMYTNKGEEHPLYFWRDQHGHEIDIVIDNGLDLSLVEIKSSKTFHKQFFKNINWFNNLPERESTEEGTCIYGGDQALQLGTKNVLPWDEFSKK